MRVIQFNQEQMPSIKMGTTEGKKHCLKARGLLKCLYLSAIILAALGLCPVAQAQEADTDFQSESVEYLTPQEYAMMLDRNDRFLIRASLISAGVEWEFIDNLSVLGQVGLTEDFWEGQFAKAELRYYLPLKSFSKSSLNGPYISAGAKTYNPIGSAIGFDLNDLTRSSLYYANLGLQRRFLGNGLADFGLRFGYKEQTDYFFSNGVRQEVNSTSFLLESKTSIGLGLTLNRGSELDYDRLCPVLKCYDTEKFLLKINFADAINLEIDQAYTRFRSNPSVAVEQKLGNLPFSAQFKVSLDYQAIDGRVEEVSNHGYSFSNIQYDLEARYYYNLNSRMRKGKTGNSLSANYFSFGYTRIDRREDYRSRETRYFDYRGFYATTGLQRTFGKRLYFDLYMGAAYLNSGEGYNQFFNDFDFVGGANVGIKF
jgi:hypothetical protein